MSEFKPVRVADALLSADNKLSEGWVELSVTGLNASGIYNVYRVINEFMSINSRPTIIDIINTICKSDKDRRWKMFHLEAVACDLSLVAKVLGYNLSGTVDRVSDE